MKCLMMKKLTIDMELENAQTRFGLPTYDVVLDDVRQRYDDTCAIKSQEVIMNAAGIDVTEDSLRIEAYENGWYTPGIGTPMQDVGKLMEAHGMDVRQQIHGSIYNLVSEVSMGHPVIVGVDSGELWHPGPTETFEDIINGHRADHALIVGGIEFSEGYDRGTINLIDPGTGDFAIGYDLDRFEDAWEDSDNFMLTID